MQDKIIARHTCFVGTWVLTDKPVYELSDVPDDLKWAKNTHMTPFTQVHFQGISNNIYGFGRLCSLIFYPSTICPPIFLPVHIRFYPS